MRPQQCVEDLAGAPIPGLWSAPGRVNLIGEHVDYNDGLCLPIALPQRTWVTATRRDDRRLRMTSEGFEDVVELDLDEVAPGVVRGWPGYVAGVLWALEQDGFDVGGLDLAITSEVPLGAGLSSSAALECAVGAAVSDLFDLGLLADDAARARLAQACVRAENEIAGAATGGMDQAASLRARAGHALLLDCRDDSARHVPFDPEAAGVSLLVVDTRTPHALVDGQYEARRRACERACAQLGVASLREVDVERLDGALAGLSEVTAARVRHVVTEIDRVRAVAHALDRDDWALVGRLFTASHASLRDDFEVSCPQLDLAVEAVLAAGGLGARMTGGGFGGSIVALVPQHRAEAAVDGVRDAFAAAGHTAPVALQVTPGGPARREPSATSGG